LPELRGLAAAAAAKLQPAQVQERQLGQSFAQQAPRLLQVAQAVVQPVRYKNNQKYFASFVFLL